MNEEEESVRIIDAVLRPFRPRPIVWDLAVVLSRYEASHEKLILHAAWNSLKTRFGPNVGWDPQTVRLRFPQPVIQSVEGGSVEVDLAFSGEGRPANRARAEVTLRQVADGLYPGSVRWHLIPEGRVVDDIFLPSRSKDIHFAVY
jgi:hypothetical protein